jgi:hypothetical protein
MRGFMKRKFISVAVLGCLLIAQKTYGVELPSITVSAPKKTLINQYTKTLDSQTQNQYNLAHLYQFLTKSPQKQSFFTYKPYLNRV